MGRFLCSFCWSNVNSVEQYTFQDVGQLTPKARFRSVEPVQATQRNVPKSRYIIYMGNRYMHFSRLVGVALVQIPYKDPNTSLTSP
jgi:hypothetical protein